MSSKTVKKRPSRSRHIRAGLHFPIKYARTEIKLKLPNRKISKYVETFLLGAHEYFLKEWLVGAGGRVIKKSHIETQQLM